MEEETPISGSVVLVNPDGSEMKVPLLQPSLNKNALEFAIDTGAVIHWTLTLKDNAEFLARQRGKRDHRPTSNQASDCTENSAYVFLSSASTRSTSSSVL
jgi:hypothetical protein